MLVINTETMVLSLILSMVGFAVGWLSKTLKAQKERHFQQALFQQKSLECDQFISQLTAEKNHVQSLEEQLNTISKSFQLEQTDRFEAQNKISILETKLNHQNTLIANTQKTISLLETKEASLQEQIKQLLAQQITLEKTAQKTAVELTQTQLRLSESQSAHDSAVNEKDEIEKAFYALKQSHTEILSQQQEREKSFKAQIAQFSEQKQALSEQFKVLANDILESKTQQLQQSGQLQLKTVMAPFQQSLDGFKKEVQEIHHRESQQQGELKKELESLKSLNQQMTNEAHQLSTALRGQKKLQGNWGELILENILERSGLEAGKDYQREVSFTTEEGKKRPDAIVYLPQNKHLVIDAKVSLNAYTRYVNSEDELERNEALKAHTQAIKDRITELSDRDYEKLPGLNSPEMVFMFIPIESAFVEALKADESLFQQAIANHVLVATPTTLLTSLNIVRQLWRYEDQNKHTALLLNKAEGVFKKLNAFLGSFEQMKKGLDRALDAYQKAEGQLVSGKGNLVKQVSEFKKLSPGIKGELAPYFTEKADLEMDLLAQNTTQPETD